MGSRIVFFDLETRKLAEDLAPDDNDLGWERLRQGKGGISALCIYDTEQRWLYCYDDHTVQAAARHLEAADLVVGFYSSKFDVPVIEGVLGRALRLRHHFDIYTAMARRHAERNVRTHPGDLKLDTLCRRNIGRGKIEHGGNVKSLIANGQWGRVFNYCADDVHLTHDLFMKLAKDGGLIDAKGKFMSIELPHWLKLES